MTDRLRILLCSDHEYPMAQGEGLGLVAKEKPSGSGQHLHDLLARGLSRLGHQVDYHVAAINAPLPDGVRWARRPNWDVDVVHMMSPRNQALLDESAARGVPTVVTCHLDWRPYRTPPLPDNWVFVSQTCAHYHHSQRYVRNGLDPSDYLFRASKDSYFLFMAALDCAHDKGLMQALALARHYDTQLIVAGTGRSEAAIDKIKSVCRPYNAHLVGDVQGRRKARLLAGAQALLLPSRLPECGPLVFIEAQLSGTPVICSDSGCAKEMITPEVGMICRQWQDYVDAVSKLSTIEPARCRQTALQRHHYMTMSKNYLREYRVEIGRRPLNQLAAAALP